MAEYTLQFQASTTLNASGLLSGATTATLTTAAFGSPTGVQLYVVDYGTPGTAEIISASISGTAVTGITRGLSGGAAGTTNHSGGATIGSLFLPQHYAALTAGTGFQTGTGSVGIPSNALKQEAWTTWTPTLTGLTLGSGTVTAKYVRLGNTVHYHFAFVLGAGSAVGSGPTFSLPVPTLSYGENGSGSSIIGAVWFEDNGVTNYQGVVSKSSSTTAGTIFVSNVSATYMQTASVSATVPFTFATGDNIIATGTYEAA